MGVMIRILKVLSPLLVLGVAGFVAMTIVRNRPEVEMQAPVITPPGVRATVVTLETVRMSVAGQGTVRPRTETQLVPEISGRVTRVASSFVTGGFFEEGDVLLTLDRFDYEQAVVSARSQLAQARLRLAQEEAEAEVAQREWDALGRGDPRELTLRKPQLEDARASVDAADANVKRAERDLERADVIAPYAGRVRTKNVDVGQFVTVGAAIASIYSVDVAEVVLALPDDELAYLDLPLAYRGAANARNPRVVLRTTFAGARYEWGGRVVRTESEIDPVSRMVQVIAEVQDPYAAGPDPRRPPLAVGMYVEAEIEGRAFDDIAVVPRAALRGRNQVLVIDSDNRVHLRDVEILRATTESVFIEGGLSAGELIAVSALDNPTEGMLVQVTDLDVDRMARVSTPAARSSPEGGAETRADQGRASEQPSWLRELLEDDPAVAARSTSTSGELTPGARRPPPVVATPSADAVTAGVPMPVPVPAATAAPGRAVVAVLPFEEINPINRDADLGVGLAQSVAMRLEAIGLVTVATSPTEARLVVGGGVQRVGDAVRVTARVVDQRNGDVVSSVKIDGTVSDLPRVHAEVAAGISDSIVDLFDAGEPLTQVERATVTAVAVRPFANVSRMPEDAAVAAAITIAVADRLAILPSVSVVTEERDAVWIISGGIQRIGNIVRITANLIDRREGTVVYAIKVDGPVDQLSRLQNEVAAELSTSVREVTL
jgi:multidrug efflux system membrane fusion protein